MRKHRSGGYECDFIDAPHNDDYCIICLLPARDPQQTKCNCAKLLCKSCYEKQKGIAGTCPMCRKRLDAFPDRNISRRLNALRVKCTSAGCPWENELGMLNGHIDNCEYVVTDCTNGCKSSHRRCDLKHHLMEECPLRQYVCDHCNDKGVYVDMTGKHLKVCPNIMVRCAKTGCMASVARKDLKDHSSICPKATIKCPYLKIGCQFVSLREKMDDHINSSTTDHLDLAMGEIVKLKHDLAKLQDQACWDLFRN
eukprot:Em0017g261a